MCSLPGSSGADEAPGAGRARIRRPPVRGRKADCLGNDGEGSSTLPREWECEDCRYKLPKVEEVLVTRESWCRSGSAMLVSREVRYGVASFEVLRRCR